MPGRPELIIGFVGPAGVRMNDLVKATGDYLKQFTYKSEEIHLSTLLKNYTGWTEPESASEDKRILNGQKMGRAFRHDMQNGEALALAALAEIRKRRIENELSRKPDVPVDSCAYLLNQLKHPMEVSLLRRVYGSSFVLIAGHAPNSKRAEYLAQKIAGSQNRMRNDDDLANAKNIIRIDEEEADNIGPDKYGQNTRATYPLADMFTDRTELSGEYETRRFVDLLFGHPFFSPKPAEVAMYHAHAGGLRSSDESRQVGAVIVNVTEKGDRPSNVDVIATGANEVPKRGGGFYWDGGLESPDARDQSLIYLNANDDRALNIKKSVLDQLLVIFKRKEWFKEPIQSTQTADLIKELVVSDLKDTQFMNIGEFQRQVHAEMAAIIDAARRGVAVDGTSMYVTTFPCHNCGKHIIAAGIRHVVYLEPYPKSRVEMLHKEEVLIEPAENSGTNGPPKVVFSPYTGIAPRQYQRLFSMSGRGKKQFLMLREWGEKRSTLSPQYLVSNAAASYLLNEREALAKLDDKHYTWDRKAICP